MAADPDWAADLRRYLVPRPFLKEQSIWALWVYRFGRRLDRRPDGPAKRMLTSLYWLAFRLAETIVGVSLPKSAVIGPGLRVWHFGSVFVHPQAVIGANCTLRQGVTIGNREVDGPAPVLGDNVECGAYAQILGGIRIGDGCRIGAMSVVLVDMPDGATAVGIPARIIVAKPVAPIDSAHVHFSIVGVERGQP
ncbi:MAG: serine acetyltransferase [Burkholderiaceae bacterium]